MDFINDLHRAIDYMEAHLLEETSYEDVARHLYLSNFHFHRTFTLITGMTPGEYMRSRRLSEAGRELILSTARVIDIALKYGYDSPESFSKAFARFHGIAPSLARQAGSQLKLFNRLKIKITLEGGNVMDYRIEKREPFKMLVKSRRFRNEVPQEDGNTEIPDFWEECLENGTLDEIGRVCPGSESLGACGPILKEDTHFQYGVGKFYTGGTVPAGFDLWTVNYPLWAVFQCIGTDGACINDVWNKIYTEFLPTVPYNMCESYDFELYAPGLEAGVFCEVWIPVEKK